jgi:hypothetical protein
MEAADDVTIQNKFCDVSATSEAVRASQDRIVNMQEDDMIDRQEASGVTLIGLICYIVQLVLR